MDQTLKKNADEKREMEKVAREKEDLIAELEEKIRTLEDQDESDQEQPPPITPTIIVGVSNTKDIQAHLMRWINRDVRSAWAPTLQDARQWVEDNRNDLEGTTIVLLVDTNNIKRYEARQPSATCTAPRAESRNKDTEILNEILTERHGTSIARTDAITIHRGQMKPDGLHITSETAEIMAERIAEAIETAEAGTSNRQNLRITFRASDQEEPQEQGKVTGKFSTHRTTAAKIIGRGGERIRKFKTLYKVDINTRETGQDERTFLIQCGESDFQKVTQLLKEIARETDERDQNRQQMESYTNAPIPIPRNSRLSVGTTSKASVTEEPNISSSINKDKTTDLTSRTPPDTESETTSDESTRREPTPTRTITIKKKATEDTKKRTSMNPERQAPHKQKRKHDDPSDMRPHRNKSPAAKKEKRGERKDNRPHGASKTKREQERTPPPLTSHQRSTSRIQRTPSKDRYERRPRTVSPTPPERGARRTRSPSSDRLERRERSWTLDPPRQPRESRRQRASSRHRAGQRDKARNQSPQRPQREDWYQKSPSPRTSRYETGNQKPYTRYEWSPHHRSRSHSPRRSSSRYPRYERREDRELAKAISTILYRSGRH